VETRRDHSWKSVVANWAHTKQSLHHNLQKLRGEKGKLFGHLFMGLKFLALRLIVCTKNATNGNGQALNRNNELNGSNLKCKNANAPLFTNNTKIILSKLFRVE
jgi:hypothetical protein